MSSLRLSLFDFFYLFTHYNCEINEGQTHTDICFGNQGHRAIHHFGTKITNHKNNVVLARRIKTYRDIDIYRHVNRISITERIVQLNYGDESAL